MQAVLDAVFRQFGVSATWWPAGGEPKAVRVIAKRPDLTVSLGDTEVLSPTAVFEVRVAEAATMQPMDRLTIDGTDYIVQLVRRLDPDRLIWTVDAYPQPPDEPDP